jgi:hypothetical protein
MRYGQPGGMQLEIAVLGMHADQGRRVAIVEEPFQREMQIHSGGDGERASGCCDQMLQGLGTEVTPEHGLGETSRATGAVSSRCVQRWIARQIFSAVRGMST